MSKDIPPFGVYKGMLNSYEESTAERMTELEDQTQEAKNDDRLEVQLAVDGVIGDISISAYLTDEGLACDVYQGDDCIASGYELFNEVGLEPPRRMED
jgi:hypothetical protein